MFETLGIRGNLCSPKRLPYKIYEEQLLRELVEEQHSIPAKVEALYQNDIEIDDITEMNVEDALTLAWERANKITQKAGRLTSRSSIEIGYGEGRCSRAMFGGRTFIFVLYTMETVRSLLP